MVLEGTANCSNSALATQGIFFKDLIKHWRSVGRWQRYSLTLAGAGTFFRQSLQRTSLFNGLNGHA